MVQVQLGQCQAITTSSTNTYRKFSHITSYE